MARCNESRIHKMNSKNTKEKNPSKNPGTNEEALAKYFSISRTRSEIQDLIGRNPDLSEQFQSWNPSHQEEFLDVCSGARGIKVVYDGIFKEIFNPEAAPERLEDLLSLLLHKKVTIKAVLPNDGARLGGESALIYTDIIVETEDGILCDVEIQKLGYAFPGQRSACYSADHLLRQYKRIRGQRGRRFTYRDIKKVYVIVFFEKSTKEFQKYPQNYIHWFWQQSDTGMELDMLQEYLYICLDIFKETMENKPIETDLEAWLSFLSYDQPQRILELTSYDAKYDAMYRELFGICQNMGKVVQMFSKELAILDRNTERYMMDEMQAEIDQLKEEAKQNRVELCQINEELGRKKEEVSEKDKELSEKDKALSKKNKELSKKDREIQRLQEELRKLRGDVQ